MTRKRTKRIPKRIKRIPREKRLETGSIEWYHKLRRLKGATRRLLRSARGSKVFEQGGPTRKMKAANLRKARKKYGRKLSKMIGGRYLPKPDSYI